MRLSSHHSCIVLILLISLTRTVLSLCVEHQHSRSHIQHAIRPCSDRPHFRRDTTDTSSDKEAKFVIDLECSSNVPDECSRVQETLAKAGSIISSLIEFKTPITVNASYLAFCQQLDDCDTANGAVNIGQAYPAVSYLMQEPARDGGPNMTRMYPQALLKQFDALPQQPDWTAYDMNAQFNSEIPWHFDGHGQIRSDQSDFLNTVIHEFIHGLGFVSAWSDDMYQRFSVYDPNIPRFLTPVPLTPPDELDEISNNVDTDQGIQPFWGFIDFPLDRLMYTKDNMSFSDAGIILNSWGSSNVMFASIIDMVNAWEASGKVQAMARQMYNYATTPRNVAWMLDNSDPLWAETSFNQFIDGSSLSHVDHDTYKDSNDYLMVYNAPRGVSFEKMTAAHGNRTLGPLILRALANLGYNVPTLSKDNGGRSAVSRPTLDFWEPVAAMVGTDSDPSPTISTHSDGPAHIPTSTPTSSSDSSSSSSPTSAVTISMLALIAALFILFL